MKMEKVTEAITKFMTTDVPKSDHDDILQRREVNKIERFTETINNARRIRGSRIPRSRGRWNLIHSVLLLSSDYLQQQNLIAVVISSFYHASVFSSNRSQPYCFV